MRVRRQRTARPAPSEYQTESQKKAADRQREWLRKRRLLRFGIVFMVAGGVMAVVHWLGHLGAFGGQPSGLLDLVAGYPLAALLLITGAIMAGQ